MTVREVRAWLETQEDDVEVSVLVGQRNYPLSGDETTFLVWRRFDPSLHASVSVEDRRLYLGREEILT